MSFFFNAAARAEHLEHVAYYEDRQRGLGARYLAAFDMAMAKVCEARTAIASNFRLTFGVIACPAFQYNVLYRQTGDDVEVLVVAPHRRRPGYWLGRL